MPETTPKPDPTERTVEALRRDLLAQRELFEAKLDGVKSEVAEVVRIKEQKFKDVKRRFKALDRARLEQKAETKDRVDAALQAQKEAAYKSEQSFTKQIDSLRDLMQSHAKGSDDKIAALTARMASREGGGHAIYLAVGIIIATAGLLVGFFHR